MNEPVSLGDAEREFFLGIYRSAVAAYKPRIENKSGVALGDIAVWDYSQLARDLFRRISNHQGPLRFLFKRLFRRHAKRLERICDDDAAKQIACYYRGGIYVSFKSETLHEEAVAFTVVHELAHALWEKLGRKPLSWQPRRKYREKYKLYVEGFATYAEKVWFLDLYPTAVRPVAEWLHPDPESVYHRGLRQVEEVVRKHGEQILLQIPKRWQSL